MYDGLVVFNIATLNNDVTKLENAAKYFESKKSAFNRNASGGLSALGQLLEKISIIYSDISSNLEEIKTFLNDYINDIESFEKQMSNRGTGYIKCGVDIRKYKNLLSKLEMDDGNLFQINNYVGKSKKSTFNDPFLGIKTFGANVAVVSLSLVEGVGNVGEMVVDGGATVVAGACSIFGADNAANAVGSFIETDWSKKGYRAVVGSTGLDNYANPDSTAANVASVSGSIGGMIAVTVITSGAAASTFGAGSGAAVAVTSGVGAATGALTGAGSETERALQQGATIEEAEKVGAIGGTVGLATGLVGGKLDAAARGVGAKYGIQGVGKICGYSLASFGVNSSEPLINVMAHTAIYKNDGSSSFMENFAKNAADENLAISMGLAGGIGAAGTMIGGLSSIRTHNNTSIESLDISDSLNKNKVRALSDTEIQAKMDQYNHLLDSSEDLRRIITNESKGYAVSIPDDVYDDYMLLKKLSGEITTGKTLDVEVTSGTAVNNRYSLEEAMDKYVILKYIEGKYNLNNTGKLIPINDLLETLHDVNRYNKFINNRNNESQVEFANAIKNLIDAANKNGVDLGLTQVELGRANYIIDNLSFDFMADALSKAEQNSLVNSIISNKFDFNEDYTKLFDSEFLSIIKDLKSHDMAGYITDQGKNYLLRFSTDVDFYLDQAYKNVLLNGVDLGQEGFDAFVSRLGKNISIQECNYLNRYKNYIFNGSGKKELLKTLDAYSWLYGDMLKKFEMEFGSYASKDISQALDGSMFFEPKDIFYRNVDKGAIGYSDGKYIHVLDTGIGNQDTNHIISHEGIHHISHGDGVQNIDQDLVKKMLDLGVDITKYSGVEHAGVEYFWYDASGNYVGRNFSGVDEVITEYFAKLINVGRTGYDTGVSYLDMLVKNGIFDNDMLKKANFGNDISILANRIIQISDKDTARDLFLAFDEVISVDKNVSKNGAKRLNDIIGTLLSKMG